METTELRLESIRVSDFNARKDLDAGSEDASIADLASSIRELGVLSPVIVRKAADGLYDLVAGQRRLLACRDLGLLTIPATIRDDLTDADSTVVSLVENVQRADMNPIDKARAYDAIRARSGSVRDAAQATGVTAPTVRKYLALLKLAPSIQEALSTSEGVAGTETLSDDLPVDLRQSSTTLSNWSRILDCIKCANRMSRCFATSFGRFGPEDAAG